MCATTAHPATRLRQCVITFLLAVTIVSSFDYDYYDVTYGVGKYIVREMLVIDKRVDTCLLVLPRRYPGDPAPGECRLDAIERLYHGASKEALIQPLSDCVEAIADPPHSLDVVHRTVQCLEDSLAQPVQVKRGNSEDD